MSVTKTILHEGTGVECKEDDSVSMLYKGWFKDNSQPENKGKLFDINENLERPFKVVLGKGQVIKGWDQGIVVMKVGEKALLDISSEFAYGPGGYPPRIPPNAILLFEVELIKIN